MATEKKFDKKGNHKGRRFKSDRDKRDDSVVSNDTKRTRGRESGANDPAWYTVNGQIVQDVANLSFNRALGKPVKLTKEPYAYGELPDDLTIYMPGIMVIPTVPAIGVSTDGSSALNLAAKNIYTFIRHANSGHSNYDSPDLMMYLLAIDNAYGWLAFLYRLYGMANVFSQVNRYVGDALIQALGFNSIDIRSNLNSLRTFANQTAIKLSAFSVPANMSLFKRHTWMYGSLFQDEPNLKCQMYMYSPALLWQYNETSGAGRLDPLACTYDFATWGSGASAKKGIGPRNAMTFSDIVNITYSLINPLVASEDINIMSGDILKAYGQEGIWKLEMIPESYSVLPLYSEEVLTQIHNSQFISCYPSSGDSATTLSDLYDFRLYQDTTVGDGHLVYSPVFSECLHLQFTRMLDMPMDQPKPEDIIVATRNFVAGVDAGNYNTLINDCGSELLLPPSIIIIGDSGNVNIQVMPSMKAMLTSPTVRSAWWKFAYAPILYYPEGVGGINLAESLYACQCRNFTTVNNAMVHDMHTSALLSMLAVPLMGNLPK